jgi:hypothetical protein
MGWQPHARIFEDPKHYNGYVAIIQGCNTG